MSENPSTQPTSHSPVEKGLGRSGGAGRRSRFALPLAALALLSLALTGCGSSTSSPSASETSNAPTSSAAAPETTEAASPAPTSEASPSTQVPASSAAPSSAALALCKAADLSGALDNSGGGAAGHVYYKLSVKNKTTKSCILDGYPGVSMVVAADKKALGAPADRDSSAPSKGAITLAPGESAAAVLRYTQAANYQNCQQVFADAVMVYPPSATDTLLIPQNLTACSNADIKLLTIGAFQK